MKNGQRVIKNQSLEISHNSYQYALILNKLLKNMGTVQAIKKLETSNEELNLTLEQLGEQFKDLREDKRFAGLIDDLENLAFNYIKTWIGTNTEVIQILTKEKK